MSKVADRLKHKVGPLPIYGWVLIIALAVVIARWYMGRNSGDASATTDSTADTSDSDTGDDLSGLSDLSDSEDPDDTDSVGNASIGGTVTNGITGIPNITTDIGWSAAVARELDAEGYSPGIVAQALADYFSDVPMGQQQYSLMELALQKFGPPPESQHSLQLASGSVPKAPSAPSKTVTPPSTKTSPKPSTTKVATPGGFSVKVVGNDIHMSWKPVKNVSHYTVTNAAGQVAGMPTTTSFVIMNKRPGAYGYKVRAVGTNGSQSGFTLVHPAVVKGITSKIVKK